MFRKARKKISVFTASAAQRPHTVSNDDYRNEQPCVCTKKENKEENYTDNPIRTASPIRQEEE